LVRKELIGIPVLPSGTIESDMTILKKHFIGVEGKISAKGYSVKKIKFV
jgi:hypothetical protein